MSDTCCVCGHKLDNHLDEGEWWRCHSLGSDTSQCECRLIKSIAEEEGISYYSLEKRANWVMAVGLDER